MPPVVAAAPSAGRLLLEHVDGPLLPEYRDGFAAWTATLARLAEIQRVLHDDLDAVRVAGVPTMTLESLADAVPSLLADPDLALVARPGGLTASALLDSKFQIASVQSHKQNPTFQTTPPGQQSVWSSAKPVGPPGALPHKSAGCAFLECGGLTPLWILRRCGQTRGL